MFYIRTADRLQRTATWFNNLEGGMDYLRSVIIDDKLGICAELEAEMDHVVGTYQCEWKTALVRPAEAVPVPRFREFPHARPERGLRPRARATAAGPPERETRAAE